MKLLNRLELKNSDAASMDSIAMPFEFKFAAPEDGTDTVEATFEGYASIFNVEDQGGDVVMPGSFKNSLKRRPAGQVKMLYQHCPSEPLGVWDEIVEDNKGLKVKGHLLTEIERVQEAYVLMKAGVIAGLSIGFCTLKDAVNNGTGIRQLLEIDLWEISLVTFPCLIPATVTAVKGDTILSDARAMEQAYRDGGLSLSEAKIAVAVTKKMVLRDGERPDPAHREGAADVIKTLRRANALFS